MAVKTDGLRVGLERWGPPAVLVGLVAAVFGRTVLYDFVNLDDFVQIVQNPIIRSLSPEHLRGIFTYFSTYSYYPVRLVSFALDYHFWGVDPMGYHLTNVLLQCANALLAWLLLLRGCRHLGYSASLARQAAFLGAGFFAIHPLVTEPVSWIPGREELLMLLFTLLCILFNDAAVRARGAAKALWYVLCAYAGLAATLSNVVGAVVPALVVLWNVVFLGERRIGVLAARTWFLWIFALIAIGTKVLGLLAYNPVKEKLTYRSPWSTARNLDAVLADPWWTVKEPMTPGMRARIVVALYGLNVASVLVPLHMVPLRPFIEPESFADPVVLFGLACIGATLALVWAFREKPLALFGLLWFLVALAPSAHIVPHHTQRADRFLYLPMVGFGAFLAGAAASMKSPTWGRRSRVALACVVAVMGVRAAVQTGVWQEGMILHRHNYERAPDHPKSLLNLAGELARRKHYEEAAALLEQRLEVEPDNAEVLHTLTRVYIRQQAHEKAEKVLKHALARHPEEPAIMANLGVVYGLSGQTRKAAEWLERALELGPQGPGVRLNLGLQYSRLGQSAEAMAQYWIVLVDDPNNAGAHLLLAREYEKRGEHAKARKHFQAAELLWPGITGREDPGGVLLGPRGHLPARKWAWE